MKAWSPARLFKVMQRTIVAHLFITVAVIASTGCAGGQKSYKETTLDDMYPILSEEQCETLRSLDDNEDIRRFVEDFWLQLDPTPGTDENELRSEYLERLEHANLSFPDRRGWGRSDRKRILLIHGPPMSTEHFAYMSTFLKSITWVKSMEIWLYAAPARLPSLPSFPIDPYRGQKRFIFADLTGAGSSTLVFSSEDYMDIDTRLLEEILPK